MKRFGITAIIFFFSIGLFIFVAACNKNIDAGSNKAYLAVTNISPDAGAVNIFFEGDPLNTSAIAYDSTTGVDGNPYLTAIAGIHNFKIASSTAASTDSPYVNGNIALQRTHYYSLFAYDSVANNNKTLKTLILQDVLNTPRDTLSSIRFLNFCDTSLYVVLTNATDTAVIPTRNVLSNSVPSSFTFSTIKSNSYQFQLVKDATVFTLDSLSVTGGKIYNLYITGSTTSPVSNPLGWRSIRLN
ncbi:MAG: DUF4397 domain-containing protein [Bacteroidetes bacterium]|nr:DUF4397 domain-containing protein [Bacteroidota bacterium]